MDKRVKKTGVRHAIKRNPAATTNATLITILSAAVELFNIHLNRKQIGSIAILLGYLPIVVNWAKNQFSWLRSLVDSGYEDEVEGDSEDTSQKEDL